MLHIITYTHACLNDLCLASEGFQCTILLLSQCELITFIENDCLSPYIVCIPIQSLVSHM